MNKIVTILGLFFLINGVSIAACDDDSGCGAGAKCIKRPGTIDRICVTILTDQSDNKPHVFSITNSQSRNVKNCSSDKECGQGLSCLKQEGQQFGSCEK